MNHYCTLTLSRFRGKYTYVLFRVIFVIYLQINGLDTDRAITQGSLAAALWISRSIWPSESDSEHLSSTSEPVNLSAWGQRPWKLGPQESSSASSPPRFCESW